MDIQKILGTGGAGFIGTNPGWGIEGCRGFGVFAVDLEAVAQLKKMTQL